MFTPFVDEGTDPAIRGFLHLPSQRNGDGIVLTHGAGSNCQSKLLVAMSDALAESGFTVLRFDLPFRLARPFGPPRPGSAEHDRQGLRRAASILRAKVCGRCCLGGHSYGGRQDTLLLAEEPDLADGLLLLSYLLHPPRKPEQLRTSHFPKLTKPAFFVHGTRDPFGSISEMQAAFKLIPAPRALFEVDGAGHDLPPKKVASDLPSRVAIAFQSFVLLTERESKKP
jgi:predicted alpha/beta-hydrolase family hydrolase